MNDSEKDTLRRQLEGFWEAVKSHGGAIITEIVQHDTDNSTALFRAEVIEYAALEWDDAPEGEPREQRFIYSKATGWGYAGWENGANQDYVELAEERALSKALTHLGYDGAVVIMMGLTETKAVEG